MLLQHKFPKGKGGNNMDAKWIEKIVRKHIMRVQHVNVYTSIDYTWVSIMYGDIVVNYVELGFYENELINVEGSIVMNALELIKRDVLG